MTRIPPRRHIFLDSFPLGVLSHPRPGPDAVAVINWAATCRAAGHVIYVPEVIDYGFAVSLYVQASSPVSPN